MTPTGRDEGFAQKIRANGWRQGAVIRPSDARNLAEEFASGGELGCRDRGVAGTFVGRQERSWKIWLARLAAKVASSFSTTKDKKKLIDPKESDWWIVITHDCDLVNHDLSKEPWVEVLLARPHGLNKLNSLLMGGRNPRRLQFEAQLRGKAQILEASVHDRWRLSREALTRLSPDVERCLDSETCRLMCQWVAKRYVRSAFPDSFMRRLGQVRGEFDKFYDRHGEHLSAVFLAVTPEDELEEGKKYRCAITLVYPSSFADLDAVEAMKDEFEDLMGECDGVELDPVRMLSGQEFTFDDLHILKRLDLDFLSNAEQDDSRPPEVIDVE